MLCRGAGRPFQSERTSFLCIISRCGSSRTGTVWEGAIYIADSKIMCGDICAIFRPPTSSWLCSAMPCVWTTCALLVPSYVLCHCLKNHGETTPTLDTKLKEFFEVRYVTCDNHMHTTLILPLPQLVFIIWPSHHPPPLMCNCYVPAITVFSPYPTVCLSYGHHTIPLP